MFKIDQVKYLLDCDHCNNLLVDPVAIVCGNSVCKKHLDELMEASPKESNTFLCKLCDDEHYIPKKGFAINKRFQNALDIKLNTLKLNPVYEECKREIRVQYKRTTKRDGELHFCFAVCQNVMRNEMRNFDVFIGIGCFKSRCPSRQSYCGRPSH